MVSHAVAGAPNTLETRQPQMSALELLAQTSLGWASQGVELLRDALRRACLLV